MESGGFVITPENLFFINSLINIVEMMPCLHNYITVDPEKFSSNPAHLEIIYNMCKTVLTTNCGEDAECHAAKLIEILLLQYKGQIDSVSSLCITKRLTCYWSVSVYWSVNAVVLGSFSVR